MPALHEPGESTGNSLKAEPKEETAEMSDSAKKRNNGLSRREILGASALAACSLAILGTGSAEAQLAKKAKHNIAGYQTSPKGRQQCENCRHFQAPNACKVVESPISPTGWCRLYAKK